VSKLTKLLLIEDNLGDSRLIQEIIRQSGNDEFELHEAEDLATGLSLVEREHVEVLLLDLALPDSTGIETFERVHREAPHLPIIILSGTSDEDLALKAVRDGAQDYFVKGAIESHILVRALRYAIERSRRERDLEIIARVTFAMRATQKPADVIKITLDSVADLLNPDAAAIMLLDPNGTHLIIEKAVGSWASHELQRFEIEGTITGEVLKTGSPFFEAQLSQSADKRLQDYQELNGGLDTLVLLPLVAEEQTIGVLALADSNPFDLKDLSAFETVANISANNIHRATLYARTRRQLEQLNSLRTIDLAINTSLDLNVIMNVLLDQVTAQLKVDAADVLLLDSLNTLRYQSGRGFTSQLIEQTQLRVGEGSAGRAAKERGLVSLPDISKAPADLSRSQLVSAEGFASHYAVALEAKGKIVGVLEVFNRTPLNPDQDWIGFLETLAGQAAIAIQNAELFENLEEAKSELEVAYDATLEGWVRALDLRDEETEGHTQRVTEMSLRLAKAAGITNGDLPSVWRGALLHDIGKIAIPDSVLNKPGPLDDEEWMLMKMHPIYARQLLSPIEYLRASMEIPYRHHEKWDGSGYPEGLKGEEIPFSARMFAIIDVWDALRSDRPYRKAWSDDEAWDYIKTQAGKHFDPALVDLFEAHFLI
jgi:response regulator RpfG family c-di-GMP phosphodiesterase